MLATIGSAALLGIDAVPVSIEVNTGEHGIPDLILVGLIVYDLVKGNNARAYIIAFIILAVSHYGF